VLVGVVEGVAQLVREASGVGEVGGGVGDDRRRVGRVVGADPAGVLLGVQPAVELPQQLREPPGHDGEFGDGKVEFGRPSQGLLVQGVVVELADRLGRVGGEVGGGRGAGTGHWGTAPSGGVVVVRSVG
jgi:hypothetical protein